MLSGEGEEGTNTSGLVANIELGIDSSLLVFTSVSLCISDGCLTRE